ncbi:MAG: hypothetical protein NW205_00420 [Hyphomicrobiaceae bacterium]|nr:hypothetical protein [Hyphomicrobiaceae bacterium]
MRRATAAALAAVGPDTPGYGFILGMNAFSLEEAGAMGEAERAGRRAVELEPADAWAVHAVSHVFEMRGRVAAGTRWLNETRGGWSACNNFAYHLAWHLALYELEAGRFDEVLHLYDTEVRPTGSDDFRDMANAVSLLWRLEQLDVDVGGRWEALATIAGRRRTDTSYVFASLHYLLALLARGDLAAADELVAGLGESAAYATDTSVTQHRVARDIGLPLAELLLRAHRTKGHMSWLSTDMVRIAGDLPRIGGSHAQRDLFLRTLIDVAAQAGDRVGFAAVTRMRAELKALDRFAVAAERRAGQARVRSSAVNRLAAAG